MADEKNVKDGAKQEGNKVLNWIKALPGRIARPFRNMVNELRRVTWPSKQKLIRYSIIVLVFVLAMMLIIGLFNLGSTELVKALRFGESEGQRQLTQEELDELIAAMNSGAGQDSAAGQDGTAAGEDGTAAGEDAAATEGAFAGLFGQVRDLLAASEATAAGEDDAAATVTGEDAAATVTGEDATR